MNIQWVTAPLIGCIIGYITNWVAIKMLFRPFKPHYLFGHRIPFTPGLIPRGKHRLAIAIGDVISRDLLSADIVKDALLGDAMMEKTSASLDALIARCADDERTLAAFASDIVGAEAMERGVSDIQSAIGGVLKAKLLEAELGGMAGKAIVDHAKKKSPSALAGLVSGILDERIKQNIISQIGNFIDSYVRDNAGQLVDSALGAETDKLMGTKLCDLVSDHASELPALKQKVLGGYRGLIEMGAERALAIVDLSAIVQARIEALDDRELERLIFSVVNKELNAIVWLGALLGFLIGFGNLLIA